MKSQLRSRERILTFGGAGTGKSRAILDVARRLPDARFFVIDNDVGSYDRLIDTIYPELDDPRVDVTAVYEWDDYLRAVDDANDQMEADDWLIVDLLGPTWDAVQSAYTEKIFGKDIESFFIDARLEMKQAKKKGMKTFDQRTDWGIINRMYAGFQAKLMQTPGHLYCATEVAAIQESDDKATRNVFGQYGVKPKGQKRNPHIFHSVILMTKTRVGEYQMTTVKDRGHEEMEDEPWSDFAEDYMIPVAGWKEEGGSGGSKRRKGKRVGRRAVGRKTGKASARRSKRDE